MEVLGQVVILGFLISTLYALIAVGFTMIFGVAGVLNLAHGAFAMLGAYLSIGAYRLLNSGVEFLSPALAAVLAAGIGVAGVAIFSPLIYMAIIRPLQDKPIVVLLATLLIGVILEQVMILTSGLNAQFFPKFIEGGIWFAPSEGLFPFALQRGASSSSFLIPYDRLLASLVAILAIVSLGLFIAKSKAGKAILAVAMDAKGATLSGIPGNRIVIMVWAISGALAAIAGIFGAQFLGISPLEDRQLTVIAFSTVVLGGLGSIPGSLLAALIIGFAETITVVVFKANTAQSLASLAILIIVLLIRPQGLMGRPFH